MVCGFFFLSSRRRHTRCSRDWSSDVCSSDLTLGGFRVIYLPSPVLKNREGCRLVRGVDPGLTVVEKGERALGLRAQHLLDLFRSQELTCRRRCRADHESKKLIAVTGFRRAGIVAISLA